MVYGDERLSGVGVRRDGAHLEVGMVGDDGRVREQRGDRLAEPEGDRQVPQVELQRLDHLGIAEVQHRGPLLDHRDAGAEGGPAEEEGDEAPPPLAQVGVDAARLRDVFQPFVADAPEQAGENI